MKFWKLLFISLAIFSSSSVNAAYLSYYITPNGNVVDSREYRYYRGTDNATWYLDGIANRIGISGNMFSLNTADFSVNDITDVTLPTAGGAWVSVSTVPVPAAVWLFGSGLICLIGFARRKKA